MREWHTGDSYTNSSDGITISVRAPYVAPRIRAVDSSYGPDTYTVDVIYQDNSDRPDVGLKSWLQEDGTFAGVLGRTSSTQAICLYAGTDIW
jgi:hypothetical protein